MLYEVITVAVAQQDHPLVRVDPVDRFERRRADFEREVHDHDPIGALGIFCTELFKGERVVDIMVVLIPQDFFPSYNFV